MTKHLEPLEKTPGPAALIKHINGLAAREGILSKAIVELEKTNAAGPPTEFGRAVGEHVSRLMNGFAAAPAKASAPIVGDLNDLKAESEAIQIARWKLNGKLQQALSRAAEERAQELAPLWRTGAKAFVLAIIRAQSIEAAAFEWLEASSLLTAAVGRELPIRGYVAPSHFIQYAEGFIDEIVGAALDAGLIVKADIEVEKKRAFKEFGL